MSVELAAQRAVAAGVGSLTVRDAVFGFLRDAGCTTVFGNPGSTELRFLRDWPADFAYVVGLHEGCVVAMADAYAQLRGGASFVNLHSAGGLGNAMGSIFSAFKNQTPMVITAGQQTRAMFPSVPFLYAQDATLLPQPYVKWAVEPARAQDVPDAIARAYYLALQPPYGPTFVSIPEDDWDVAVEPLPARSVDARFTASRDAIAAVLGALRGSRRPAFVVGPGVDRDGAAGAAVELAERTGAAVFVSPFSSRCSFPERHPNFAGFLPPVRSQIVELLRGFDLVLVLGAPIFTYHVFTPGPPIADGTRVIQFIDDPTAAASAVVGSAILTTLREPLETLVREFDAAPIAVPARRAPPRELSAAAPMSGAHALQTLARALPAGAIIVEEAPSHRAPMHDYLPIETPGTFFAAASGSLGWGLPAAVGAALAKPGIPIVALLGDGSSMYAIQGLWTAKRLGLPITFVILNNGAYAAMNQFSRYLGYAGAPSFDLAGLDFVRAAETFGCVGVRVTTTSELAQALAAGFAAGEPRVIDAVLNDDAAAIY
jgi:benzoylformate decarboxylase